MFSGNDYPKDIYFFPYKIILTLVIQTLIKLIFILEICLSLFETENRKSFWRITDTDQR